MRLDVACDTNLAAHDLAIAFGNWSETAAVVALDVLDDVDAVGVLAAPGHKGIAVRPWLMDSKLCEVLILCVELGTWSLQDTASYTAALIIPQ